MFNQRFNDGLRAARYAPSCSAAAKTLFRWTALGGLYSRIHALRRISAATPGRMAVTKQEYADLVEAIRNGSAADAVDVARRHLRYPAWMRP